MLSKANWQLAVAEKGICKNVELRVSCQEQTTGQWISLQELFMQHCSCKAKNTIYIIM